MRIFVLSLSLISSLPQLLSAADSSVPADGSGYLDDRKLQMPVTAAPTNSKKKPVKKVIEAEADELAPVLTQVTENAPVAEGEGFPVVPVIVGALVLAGLVGGGVTCAPQAVLASPTTDPETGVPVDLTPRKTALEALRPRLTPPADPTHWWWDLAP